jgi:hypothetical protein
MRKDYRNERRQELGIEAWIRFDDGFSVRPCMILDMSNSSVRIELSEPYAVADRFSLLMTRQGVPGRRCRVRRRHGREIAADFVGTRKVA